MAKKSTKNAGKFVVINEYGDGHGTFKTYEAALKEARTSASDGEQTFFIAQQIARVDPVIPEDTPTPVVVTTLS